jgi:colanic acid biosynthesis glycosyl transferase WcaI
MMARSKRPNAPHDPLWVVTELYYPEETSTGYYMTRIAEGLAPFADVKALCGQPNYSSRGTKAPKREIRNGVEIFRVAGTTLDKNVIIFRLINMITLSISTFARALVSFQPRDSVLVVTTPPSLPFVVALAALLRGAHYTLLIHDNYPEILFAVGKSSENSSLANVLNFCNRWLYKNATRLIAVGRDMRVLLERKTAGLASSIDVIQNWAELETVHPEPRETNPLLKELGMEDKFVFLYAGNMGHPNDLETIVETAKLLAGEPQFQFIFLGTGAKEPALRREAEVAGLTNITLLPPKPRAEQVVFLNACDVALVSLVPKMWGVSMPSRTYNILAAGKPILALTEPESELAIVIDEDKVGWHLPPGDAAAMAELVRGLYDHREEMSAMGERARRAALDKYSLQKAIGSYRQVLGFED